MTRHRRRRRRPSRPAAAVPAALRRVARRGATLVECGGGAGHRVLVLIWTLMPIYNMVHGRRSKPRAMCSATRSGPPQPVARQLLDRRHPGLLVPRAFLAPVRQQLLYRRR